MDSILYVDGFQEDKKSTRSPWKQLVEYFGENVIESVDIPGDSNNPESKEFGFSMTAVKNAVKSKIIDILEKTPGKLKVVAYSLSTRSTIDAISDLSQEYKDRIELFLIHPAYNPLHAVKVMDWLRSEEFPQLQDDEYYLNGDVTQVFNTLIDNWKGNGIQFQEDLRNYNKKPFGNLTDFESFCGNQGFQISILGNKISNDLVIHQIDEKGELHDYGMLKKGKVIISHLPKLTDEMFVGVDA